MSSAISAFRAVIYVLAGPGAERDEAWCVIECQRCHWLIEYVVVDASQDGAARRDVIRMLHERRIDVVVVADPAVFSGGGVPRLVIAANPTQTVKPGTGRRHRPRILR